MRLLVLFPQICKERIIIMSLEENKVLARRWNEEIWSKANLSVVDEFLATNFVFNYAPPGMAPDKEGYKQAVTRFHNACPDMYYDIEDVIAEGDKVVLRWSWYGVQEGEEVKVTGISILHIVGGKIVEEWSESSF